MQHMKSDAQQGEFAMTRVVREMNQRFKDFNGPARSLVPEQRHPRSVETLSHAAVVEERN